MYIHRKPNTPSVYVRVLIFSTFPVDVSVLHPTIAPIFVPSVDIATMGHSSYLALQIVGP